MALDIKKLTREDLSRFLPDERSIRAFQNIFDGVIDYANRSNNIAYGDYYANNNATETIISSPSSPVKVLGTTTNGGVNSNLVFDDNKVTLTSNINIAIKASAVLNITTTSGDSVNIYFAKNGVVINKSISKLVADSSGFIFNGVISTIVSMGLNDYLEIYAENSTAANNLTATEINFNLSSLI